ncbi:TonB-dependent receptor [Taibaiella helva]|uniref:TonB-dependent receptor n=1 Tax=Taibaiella helva TaxID=2301235 RepID=UPI0013002D3D|nr:TonB-dependent receptor [Taibaiella helva]
MNRYFTVFIFCCCSLSLTAKLCAQSLQDTLKEVRILEQHRDSADVRKLFTAGQQTQTIEKVYKDLYSTQSLANLLSQQTPVFVKSYGINGIATLSLRGASAAQSTVLWNGVPILNPALGVADISILSTGLFDRISLQYGSSAALFGSGNVGGALLLEQYAATFTKDKLVDLTLGGGSYGRRDIGAKAVWQNNRWRVSLRGFYQHTANDFPYANDQGEERKLSNARLNAGGGLFTADYKLGRQDAEQVLSLQVWYQQYRREIPPALFEQYSVKKQTDASLRSLLGWHKQTRRSYFYAKASLNREYLHYQDSVVLPDNRNNITQYYQELGWKFRLDASVPEKTFEHYVLLFSPLQYAVAKGNNISNKEEQFRPAIVATYSLSAWKGRLKANAALRQEWVNGKAAPLLPGAGADFSLLQLDRQRTAIDLRLQGNVQRSYRIPTLNELYYFPGGNINLKPEQGWNIDGGYAFVFLLHNKRAESLLRVDHQLHAFNRNIHDWVYWLGGAIWTPYNIAEVHSRGMETDNTIRLTTGPVQWHVGMKYAYVLSTTVSSYQPNDGSAGKQIPYAPRYNGQVNAGCTIARLFLNYNHTYTGYRFVTVDESQYLEPYQTGNLQLLYNWTPGNYRLGLSAQIQNLWNTRYEVVNARPMPGRYFIVSLQLGWRQS